VSAIAARRASVSVALDVGWQAIADRAHATVKQAMHGGRCMANAG